MWHRKQYSEKGDDTTLHGFYVGTHQDKRYIFLKCWQIVINCIDRLSCTYVVPPSYVVYRRVGLYPALKVHIPALHKGNTVCLRWSMESLTNDASKEYKKKSLHTTFWYKTHFALDRVSKLSACVKRKVEIWLLHLIQRVDKMYPFFDISVLFSTSSRKLEANTFLFQRDTASLCLDNLTPDQVPSERDMGHRNNWNAQVQQSAM